MNEIIVLLVLFFEMLMALQCLQIAFNQQIHIDRYTIGIVLLNVSLYGLVNFEIIPAMCSILVYVFLFLYSYLEFRKKLGKTIVGCVIALVFVGVMEGVLSFLSRIFTNQSNSKYVLLILSASALVITYCIKRRVINFKHEKFLKLDQDIYGVTILLIVISVILLRDYYFVKKIVNVYVVCILLCLIIIMVYLYRLEYTRNEVRKKNYELELQTVYGAAYEKLIADVRRRQHDYKNQLSAIYSMHLTAKTLEELIAMQNEYIGKMQGISKFDAILVSCNNKILAGYLYQKCLDCENAKISIEYKVHIDQAECRFRLHEVIELLGILIDNACESVELLKNDSKRIKMLFVESEKEIIFKISNPSKYIAYSEIQKMFCAGYSTKGKNRGIGLARVLELTKKYDSELKVKNVEQDSENWIEFFVEMEKEPSN